MLAGLSCGLRNGYAGRGVSVEHEHSRLDFRDLAVEASRHQGLAQQLFYGSSCARRGFGGGRRAIFA
ncbi:MAG: hypothetical protein QNJ09_04610, partial [Paracoccaceae bacterium]|nr:hypothetical protein [Paracoccaceae bacterium]